MISKLTFSEDGSLKIGNECESLSYHKSLNVVIITYKTGNVKVVDLPSGFILRECQLVGKFLRALLELLDYVFIVILPRTFLAIV